MRILSQTRLLPIAAALAVSIIAGCSSSTNDNNTPATAATAQATATPAAPVAGAASATSTQVTISVAGPGVVELALPMNPDGKRQQYSDIRTTGTWAHTFNGERIQSTQQGSAVTLHLLGNNPAIPFLQSPKGAEVSLKYGDATHTISLHGDTYGFRPETINTSSSAPSASASAH